MQFLNTRLAYECCCCHMQELPQCSDQDSMTQVDPGTITVTPAAPMSMVGRNSSAGQVSVVQLLRSLGTGHRLLMQYKSAEAVEAFNLLPCQHHQTPWVLTQMGKAHFEMVNYNEARYFFEWSLEQDPNRVEGLEWYSTVLWHMKKEVCVLTNSRPSQPRAGGLFQVLYRAVIACGTVAMESRSYNHASTP